MLKEDNKVITTKPSALSMVEFVYSSRHKEEEDISEILGEYKIDNKNQFDD